MLRGERVTLRARTREDMHREWQFRNDVAFEILTGGDPWEPQSLERALAGFDQESQKGDRDGTGFAIDVGGTYIGSCGLFQHDPIAATSALGIGIGDPAYLGQGYGREALRLLLDYGFRLRNLRRIWLTVHGTNERAQRAYRACGFVEEGRLRAHAWSDGQYVDLVYMGILRDEWARSGEAVTHL